jgi:hypothetical protein
MRLGMTPLERSSTRARDWIAAQSEPRNDVVSRLGLRQRILGLSVGRSASVGLHSTKHLKQRYDDLGGSMFLAVLRFVRTVARRPSSSTNLPFFRYVLFVSASLSQATMSI